jgi:hypothetical protein
MKKAIAATAFHEAGHAAACIHEGIKVHSISIVPEDGSGRVKHRNVLASGHIEYDISPRNRLKMEKLVRMSLSGRAAQHRFCPRSIRHYHAREDVRFAFEMVSFFAGSEEETSAYFKLLDIQARAFVRQPWVWAQINAIAAAVMEHKVIEAKDIRRIARESITKYQALRCDSVKQEDQ